MAIQIDLQQSNFGVPFKSAYFRISTASLMRQRQNNPRHVVMIDVIGYAAQPQNEDTKEVESRRYYAPAVEIYAKSGSDFLAQCYSWVMDQKDMAGAVAA